MFLARPIFNCLKIVYNPNHKSGIFLRMEKQRTNSMPFLSSFLFTEIAKHMQTSMQIFVIVLIYIVYFFGTSAWDGKGKNR